MMPDAEELQSDLATFCKTVGADEIVLFEKSTFLEISHFDSQDHEDKHRFEKISN